MVTRQRHGEAMFGCDNGIFHKDAGLYEAVPTCLSTFHTHTHTNV